MKNVRVVPERFTFTKKSIIVSLPLSSVVVGRLGAGAQPIRVFGKPANAVREGKAHRMMSFMPRSILWFLTCRTGSTEIGLDWLKMFDMAASGERRSSIDGVTRVAETLSRVRRATDIEELRSLIAAVQAQGFNRGDASMESCVMAQSSRRAREALPAFSILAQPSVVRRRKRDL